MIRGIEVLTTVWSIADVNIPSNVPAITIALVRPLISEIGLWVVRAAATRPLLP